MLSLSKAIVVVDEHVNVHDYEEVFFYVGANVDPKRDVVLTEGPLDHLDHAPTLQFVGRQDRHRRDREGAGGGHARVARGDRDEPGGARPRRPALGEYGIPARQGERRGGTEWRGEALAAAGTSLTRVRRRRIESPGLNQGARVSTTPRSHTCRLRASGRSASRSGSRASSPASSSAGRRSPSAPCITLVFGFLWIRDLTSRRPRARAEVEPETRRSRRPSRAAPRALEGRPACRRGATRRSRPTRGAPSSRRPRSVSARSSAASSPCPCSGSRCCRRSRTSGSQTSTSARSTNFPEGQFMIATYLEDTEVGEVTRRTMFIRYNGSSTTCRASRSSSRAASTSAARCSRTAWSRTTRRRPSVETRRRR